MTDPALGFWLRTVESAGGIAEPAGDATLVLLPPPLAETYGLPEELHVTADPDVAREDGITFVGSGHPVLTQAASALLDAGDPGHSTLARPPGAPPGRDCCWRRHVGRSPPTTAGSTFPASPPWSPTRSYGSARSSPMSCRPRFQEKAERWVDSRTVYGERHLAGARVPMARWESVLARLAPAGGQEAVQAALDVASPPREQPSKHSSSGARPAWVKSDVLLPSGEMSKWTSVPFHSVESSTKSGARRRGLSWDRIGEALGMRRQSAWERFG